MIGGLDNAGGCQTQFVAFFILAKGEPRRALMSCLCSSTLEQQQHQAIMRFCRYIAKSHGVVRAKGTGRTGGGCSCIFYYQIVVRSAKYSGRLESTL